MTKSTRRFVLKVTMACACSFAAAASVRASTIIELTSAIGTVGVVAPAQSLTTPAGGPWDDITFNFYSDAAATTPIAPGNLFILTQEYLGFPENLSSSTPGFFAQSTGASGGVYQFDPSVILQGGTHYFFYASGNVPTAGINNQNGLPSGIAYSGRAGAFNFGPFGNTSLDYTFNLSGTVVTVPEPMSMTLLGVGLVGLARRWRQRKT